MAAAGLCLFSYSLVRANSPAYPSSSQTDVKASDTTNIYPEEALRAALLRDSKIIYVNAEGGYHASRDSAETMMAKFYDDQFRHSQDPEAPTFTFMSKDANLVMGIGANMVLSGWYNWGGYISGEDFSPYSIQIPKTPETDRSINGSAARSSLFFSVIGKNDRIGEYRVYIQGGFSGYAHTGFKIKKAYVQIHNVTAGLAPTTFSDPASQPDVLDSGGANGKVGKTHLLVRYMKTFKGKWSLAGSAELPSSKPDISGGKVSQMLDYVPDFAALGQYQWNRGLSHIRLAGILRTMSYRELATGQTHSVTGWGALAGSTVKACRNLTIYAQGSVGKGMSAYTGDLSNGNYDLLADPADAAHLYAPTTVSAIFGLKYYWKKDLTSTVALGTLRNFAKDGTDDSTYRYGQYLAANINYHITPRLQVGMEYEAGKRMNYNRTHGNANRLLATFVASF